MDELARTALLWLIEVAACDIVSELTDLKDPCGFWTTDGSSDQTADQ